MLRPRVPGLRPIALVLATTVASTSGATALAAPDQGSAESAEDPLAPAQKLYERGRAQFDTADYDAAVDAWTDAYALVPDSAEGTQIKVLLIYNIATAREKAFDVDHDPTQLRKAKILLGNFEQNIPGLYGEGAEADTERARVQAKIKELDERLAEYERSQNPEPEPQPEPEPEPEPEPADVTDDPQPDPAAKGLIIGGAVGLSLGAAGLGVMAAGIGMGNGANDLSSLEDDDIEGRRAQFERGRTGNTLAIAGGIAAGVFVVAGGVMLALGLKRKRSSNVALLPSVGPQSASLSLRARF
ncbi:MAG: hypothetical protein AAF799_38290 [Myxococcota bacterium]